MRPSVTARETFPSQNERPRRCCRSRCFRSCSPNSNMPSPRRFRVTSAERTPVIERSLVDYYRCPEDFVKMSLAGDLSTDPGYFRFGPDICYGRTTEGERAGQPRGVLYDALS